MDDLKSTPTDLAQGEPSSQTTNKPLTEEVKTSPPPPPPPPLPAEPTPPPPPIKSSPPTPPKKEKANSLYPLPPSTKRGPKKKLMMGLLTFFIIIFGGISIVTAWKLRQVEKVTPEEAEAWVGTHCSESCVIRVGPGKYGYVAAGHGMATVTHTTISVKLPAGTKGYEAYAFWSGEGEWPYNDTSIKVNSWDVEAIKTFSAKNPYAGTSQIANLGKIPNVTVRGKTGKIDFNVAGLDNLNSDNSGGSGHGIGIVVIYTGKNVGWNKIILRLWGEWLYLACAPHDNRDACEGPRSKIMSMNLANLDLTRKNESKFTFFFGEGEKWRDACVSEEQGSPVYRPNHLYYKTSGNWIKLEAKTGTPNKWPACPLPDASQPGYWWTTRTSGENLDPIEVGGESIQFVADSANQPNESKGDGDSYTFVGVVAQYPVTGPTPTPTPGPLTCLNLEGEPETLLPGDELTLTCTGSSDPDLPIDHFEFRVSSDSGTPVELSPVSATKTNGEWQGTTTYEVPDYACYNAECRVCRSSDSSECTEWGQAQ